MFVVRKKTLYILMAGIIIFAMAMFAYVCVCVSGLGEEVKERYEEYRTHEYCESACAEYDGRTGEEEW